MHDRLFDAALGATAPWSVKSVEFDEAARVLTVAIDFAVGPRSALEGAPSKHPVYDTVTKTYRYLKLSQHVRVLQVRTPRVKLSDGSVQLIKPLLTGRLSSCTLLFEALVLDARSRHALCGRGAHRGHLAAQGDGYRSALRRTGAGKANFSGVTELAIDETSYAYGHDHIELVADTVKRLALSVTAGHDSHTSAAIAAELGCPSEQIESASVDMSLAFFKGVGEQLLNAHVTFDKFHGVWHANAAVNKMRCIVQCSNKSLKGTGWSLLKDRDSFKAKAAIEFDFTIARGRVCVPRRLGSTRGSCPTSWSAISSTSCVPCCCTGASA